MLSYFSPFILVYILIVIWIISVTYYYHKRITCMVGMMIAMVLGMTIGLSAGTVIGMVFPDHFFQATVVSMFIGAFVGVIAGMPINIMAVLDGLLSGLMGGMMGAMLGVMIPPDNSTAAIKIIALLSVGILYILFLMIQGEIKSKINESKWKKLLFSKPQPMFILICSFVLLFHPVQFIPTEAERGSLGMNHSGMYPSSSSKNQAHGGHAAKNNAIQASKARQIIIEADDFSFPSGQVKIKQGEVIELVLSNVGKVEHDFEIVGTDIHVHAQPGSQKSVSFSLNKPGKYKAICTLPGHKEAGMPPVLAWLS